MVKRGIISTIFPTAKDMDAAAAIWAPLLKEKEVQGKPKKRSR